MVITVDYAVSDRPSVPTAASVIRTQAAVMPPEFALTGSGMLS